MGVVLIALDELVIDRGINPRAGGINADHAAEITEWLKANPKRDTPAVVVYRDPASGDHLLSEGFHRETGYRQAGRTHIPCEIRDGDRTAALLNAVASNQSHGLKRSNDDKRLAVRLALATVPEWSDGRIAEHIGVSQNFVSDMRRQLKSDLSCEPAKRVGKDGKARKVPAKKPKKNKPQTQQPEPVKQDNAVPDDEGDEGTPKQAAIVPPVAVDGWGIPIQPHAEEAFAAGPRFKELLAAIQTAQRLFNEVANLPGGKFLTLPDVSSYRRGKKTAEGEYADRFVHEGLETAYRQVKNAAPTYTVCPYQYADAPHPADCRCCRGLNWTPPLTDSIPKICIERAKEAFHV